MSDIVTTEIVGRVGLIALNNPPVNAAGAALRQGLVAALETLTSQVAAIGLFGEGRTFIAGADIREFGKPPIDPWLPEVCNRIEASATPVVAIIHGTALGGGLEVAMGCHARVALPGARVGLPEVLLGIIPGAGGTQRAPRLAGVPAALQMITSGRHIPAPEALEMGLIDRIEEGAPRDVALAMAEALADGTLPHRRTGDLPYTADPEAVAEWRAKMTRAHPHLFSPLKCVEAVEGAYRPILEGVAFERDLYRQCIDSPQRGGLIHAFFAERAVAKVPEATATPHSIAATGVIGGGTMGAGIATALLTADLPVTLVERDAEALDRARATITGNLNGAVSRGKMDSARRDAALANLTLQTDFAALAQADLIVEAVFEDMALKREIFARLDALAKPGAVLATNTSYLDVAEIASATNRPGNVLGLHFFSPAHIMRLLEVVVAGTTAPETAATGFALAKRLKKIGVRAGNCDGFIGNRILNHYRKAADYLVLDGASPWQVDAAIERFGFAMGPFAVSDLAGLDIGWANRKRQAATRPKAERYSPVADRICEAGWFGRKTGQGYYTYAGKDRRPRPEVETIIDTARDAAGITPRSFSDEQIVDRYMTAMILESARVVQEGIALRPVDVDAVFLFGYGFPRFRGGPLFFADTIGAQTLIARTQRYAEEDPHYWRIPDILTDMAASGGRFADLNER